MRASAYGLAAAAGVVVIVSSVAGPVPRAEAKPEFARREGKECSYCHVNPRGGGPRNAKGSEYERNGFKFAASKGYGEDDAFSSEATGRAFYFVKEAMGLEHWGYALRRLADLRSKERKGHAAELVLNTETQVDDRGRDLLRAAKEAVAAGKAAEAAEALARVDFEFKGRDAAKDVTKVRADLLKLPDGKDADAAAKAAEPQRLQWLDAQMKVVEGDVPGALKMLRDLVSKHANGPFTEPAKAKIADLEQHPPEEGQAPAPAGKNH